MTIPRHPRRRTRAGFTLIEVLATSVLLLAVFGIVGQVVRTAQRRTREVDDRRLALRTAGNVLERFTSRPWSEVTQDAADQLELPAEAAERLPDARLDATVDEADGVKRIVVAIRREGAPGGIPPAARLVTWIHARGGER